MTHLGHDKNTIKSMYELVCYAFNKTSNQQAFEAYSFLSQNSDTFAKVKNQTVTNQTMVLNLETNLFNQTLKMAGIGYVASYPETRGQGGIKDIFIELFEYLYNQNIPVSYLAPFSQIFYRKLGYENAIWQKQYQISNKSWPFLTKTPAGNFKRITWQSEEISIIKNLYAKYSSKKHGNLIRSNWWWEYLKLKKPAQQFAILLTEEDQALGYIAYEMNETFQINELVYQDFNALCQLLSFASSHSATFEKFTYKGQINEDITACFTETQHINVEIAPYMMIRIIDFKNYFNLIKNQFKFDKEINISITDHFCHWNNSTFNISQNGCKETNQLADLNADISTWSAIFTGSLSLKEAYFRNLVTGEQAIIDKLHIPSQPLTLTDYF